MTDTQTTLPGLVRRDPWLSPYTEKLRWRQTNLREKTKQLTGTHSKLSDMASGHEYYGLHKRDGNWVFREWAPKATAIWLVGEFNDWHETDEFRCKRIADDGTWELWLPKGSIKHGQLYHLSMHWHGGRGDRLPAWGRRVVQDSHTKTFSAQVWDPSTQYKWKNNFTRTNVAPLIYEAHVGMAQEEGRVGTYVEFRDKTLPRIIDAGYNTIQLMAIQEHPYYGSFGYHVSSFFAASSRFGTPEELKSLIDTAHGAGIAVIMDIVHSHAVKNEVEGISRFDGSLDQFFHSGDRGNHSAWDSRCFDYGKDKVVHFLLSNCRFWLDEYHFDGFRFDGVTSMLYHDHGLGKAFTSYDDYFGDNIDPQAVTYLTLANQVIHEVRPDAITIAEDVSGMPGLAAKTDDAGIGFDYRLSMGIPDYWIKLIKEFSDENWDVNWIWHELTNRRADEKTISYAESHDQALVGDKTIIFRLIDQAMYWDMGVDKQSLQVDRGLALHKMIRLITIATAGGGYLNFMGNEFGHPEWIDFPRQGNNWSYHYARRQWSLRDNQGLRYKFLADFDRAMIELTKRHRLIENPGPRKLTEHVADHILSFERDSLLFVFNFDTNRSYTDYQIRASKGLYRLMLDSDAAEFGGFRRLQAGESHKTVTGYHGDPSSDYLQLYIPNRSVQVYERKKP